MRSLLFVLVTVCCVTAGTFAQPASGNLTRYVDPFLGTGGHGHTYPGATVPFGMVQVSPDNGRVGWDWCSGYHYSDSMIVGFSHTHLSGTGCADLGDIGLMPATSWTSLLDFHGSRFSHKDEFAEPGYYRVKLLSNTILVELTATDHVGFHRYTFPACDSSMIMIDLKRGQEDNATDTHLEIVDSTIITGYRFSNGWAPDQRIYFAARFSRPIMGVEVTDSSKSFHSEKSATGPGVRAALYFGPMRPASRLLIKVGVSSSSEGGALKNLDAEIPAWEFETVRNSARAAWEKELEKVRIETPEEETKTVFYTALYHAFLAPTEFSDVDGKYRGADGVIHTTKNAPYYSTYSLWDTYRAAHPLYTILQQDRVNGLMQSMLAFGKESGYLPVWQLAANETNCMVGYHAVPPLADAYLKGFRGFDGNAALEAMEKSATRDHRGLRYYSTSAPEVVVQSLSAVTRGASPDSIPEGSMIVSGYASSDSGATIGYHSSDPAVNRALIVRATDGLQAIEWKTERVMDDKGTIPRSYVWMAGVGSGKGGHSFTLSVDGDSLLAFRSASNSSERNWSVAGKNGSRLSFATQQVDDFGDLFGNMTLTLPGGMPLGSPLRLRITGEKGSSSDWIMTFEHPLKKCIRVSNEIGLVRQGGKVLQLLRIDVEHLGKTSETTVHAGDAEPVRVTVVPGQSTVYVPVPIVQKETPVAVRIDGPGISDVADSVVVLPVKAIGYVPADKERESVSKSLEYAIDDFCIAAMARAMGKKSDASAFSTRASGVRELFDPSTGFFRGRNLDGSWVDPFNPRFSTEKQPEYTEGNAWQYLWLMPQDVMGLMELLGGREEFDRKLDSLFDQSSDLTGTGATADVSGLVGLYAQGNEPSHHIAYLYDYDGNPWKTQKLVHKIMSEFYKTGTAGLCGNEDCGQMSAWYVFSAMGFYPVAPIGGVYAIGTPMVSNAVITVGRGKTFVVEAKNLSALNFYIQSATLNGEPLDHPWITHRELMNGGSLKFVMGGKPNPTWGHTLSAMPPTLSPR